MAKKRGVPTPLQLFQIDFHVVAAAMYLPKTVRQLVRLYFNIVAHQHQRQNLDV